MDDACATPSLSGPSDLRAAPLGLLVIQPTPFCNLDCSYCYLPNRASKTRMTPETIDWIVRFIQKVPFARTALPIVWHAGEPLVLPRSFYEQAFQAFAAASPAVPVQHHFQTNATLLDDAWCDFIRRFSVCVGVSIDGPKHIHDRHRVSRRGRGTFDLVMRGIAKLREHRIPFTIISVISRAVAEEPDDVWRFLSSLGASQLAFNIEEAEGVHAQSTLASLDAGPLLNRFFARVADLVVERPDLPVRELDEMRRHLSAPPGSDVARANNRPGAIISIDVAGNIATLSPELLGQTHPRYGNFAWGNVHKHSLHDVLRHPGFVRVQKDVDEGVRRCREKCGYFAICGGGNPSNKLAELGTLTGTETLHCRLHVQAVADVVLARIERQHGLAA
jgi:uncharacterized protein